MTGLDEAAARHASARAEEQAARYALRNAVLREKTEHGTPDAELARRAGVTRMTVLEWLGKRAPRRR